jgi:hypothetical protein
VFLQDDREQYDGGSSRPVGETEREGWSVIVALGMVKEGLQYRGCGI